MRIQFDIPREVFLRLANHPDFPSRRGGRMKFYRDTFVTAIEAPETMMERFIRNLRKELNKARQSEFWRERVSKK